MNELNGGAFISHVQHPGVVALIVFYADWCAPSRLQISTLDSLTKIFGTKVVIGQVNVDLDPSLADQFQARTLPTSLLMAGGELVEIVPGYQQEEFLKQYLDQLLESASQEAPPSSS